MGMGCQNGCWPATAQDEEKRDADANFERHDGRGGGGESHGQAHSLWGGLWDGREGPWNKFRIDAYLSE